ncbi:MAG: hypothetical protein E7623_04105 [Ruminococcaceae bacterium]|nr:hypothetical protein [Oscillospiraceae bacterium]
MYNKDLVWRTEFDVGEPDATNFAATIAEAMGLEKEAHMSESVAELRDKLIEDAGGHIEKAVFFHADAIPSYVVEKYPEMFETVRKHSPVAVPFHAVMPSITPVCFAAMFSGTYPDKNGVPKGVQPMITDTVIQPSICVTTHVDIFVKAGKKVAVVTCADGCIASMLYGRGADMYIIPGDDDVAMFRKADELVRTADYDVIILYNLSYDATMHRYGPESKEALQVLKENIDRYNILASHAREVWKNKRMLAVFNNDHGAHTIANGGYHGEDIPEDMDMVWFFGAYPKQGSAE